MSSNQFLKFLTDEDFSVSNGKFKLDKISGFAVVLFYSTQCQHCGEFVNIIKQMHTLINGAHFGLLNIDTNKGIITKTKNSNLELSYVPYLVFFANSNPYMIYSGPTSIEEIKNFVIQVSLKYNKEQKQKHIESQSNIEGQGVVELQDSSSYLGQRQRSLPTNQRLMSEQVDDFDEENLACNIDDKTCIQNAGRRYDSCYLSMAEAYKSNILVPTGNSKNKNKGR